MRDKCEELLVVAVQGLLHLPPAVTTLSSLGVNTQEGMWEQWPLKRLN
jgi:hypothetical protein